MITRLALTFCLTAATLIACAPTPEQKIATCVQAYEKAGYPEAYRARFCGMSEAQLVQIIECMEDYGPRPRGYVEHPCIENPYLRPGQTPAPVPLPSFSTRP